MTMASNQTAPIVVEELAALTTMPCYFVNVTDKYPVKPYLLFSDPNVDEAAFEQDLSRSLDSFSSTLFVTYVDSTPGNVESSRAAVREAFGGKYGLVVGGRFVKRSRVSTPIVEADEGERDESGRLPFFAVDQFDLINL